MVLFGLEWSNLTLTLPHDGDTLLGLPLNTGVIQMRLSAETKSDRSRTADVIIAFMTSAGLRPGLWLTRLRNLLNLTPQVASTSSELIFQHPNDKRWTSAYFRQTYLWPSLQSQRLAGVRNLQPFDGSANNSSMEKFWSMHSYRRGARTHVSVKRDGCKRKATEPEVHEHGRWRLKRENLPMGKAYQQWSLLDRLSITLLCM